SANIAGWSIDASAIYSGTRGANGAYTTSGMTIGSAGYISSPNTFISSSGVLYSKSGNIAGYSFDAGKFYVSTDFVLDAVNKKWYFANKSTYAAITAGIFMGLDAGVYKVNIGGPASNIKWTGTALEINGGSLTSANITGATITGGTVQTAASGQRVVLDGADNKVIFYSNNGWGGEIYTDTLNMHYMTANHHVFDQSVIVNNGRFIINDVASRFTWGNKELPVYHGARVGNNVTIPPEPTNPRVGDLDWENNTSLATKKMRMYTPDGWKTLTFS
ncbi:MAG TPA: hypothetical protein VHP30_16265, partial [Ignavibacteriales bacterium]|nr:hypothetical protein [Ignavibacteriales bacterium]